jgi:pseudaminic acid biosynthesis-associated methylase
MAFHSEQEEFWARTYAEDYIRKNSSYDLELGAEAWRKMLRQTNGAFSNYLECGCNIGRNVELLKIAYPAATPSVIEISEPAFRHASEQHQFEQAFQGPILSSSFAPASFDLVFTMGVLIHINPDQLLAHMQKMFDYSRKYILIGEYFNRTPTSIEYQGQKDRLFKCDFGKLFIERFPVQLCDYGFLWGHIYDSAGFDDFTWWLFEK